jgi:hypothetical protein
MIPSSFFLLFFFFFFFFFFFSSSSSSLSDLADIHTDRLAACRYLGMIADVKLCVATVSVVGCECCGNWSSRTH